MINSKEQRSQWHFLAVILLVLVNNIASVQAQDSSTISAAINVGVLDNLLPSLQNNFFPGLIAAANNFAKDGLSATAQEGTCCGLGDLGVKAEARVYNFVLNPLTNSQISLEAVSISSTTARIRIKAVNLNVGVSASASVGAAAGIGISCSVGATATLFMSALTVGVDISTVPNEGKIKINPTGELSIPSVVLVLTPIIDNVCSVVAALLSAAFNTLSLTLSSLIVPFLLGEVFPNFLGELIGDADDQTVSFANIDSFSVFNTAQITPKVNLQQLQSASNVLRGDGSGTFLASLTAPAYRAGRYFAPEVGAAALPEATLVTLASANLSFAALNNLVANIWYAAWASFAGPDNTASLESPFCKALETPGDACPFPPITQQSGFFDGLLLGLFFFGSLDFYWGFGYELVVPPPSLDFVDGLLAGSAGAKIGVYGNSIFRGPTLLATISANAAVSASIPSYDTNTGILQGFALSTIDLVDAAAEVAVFSLLGLFQGLLLWAVDGVVAAFSPTLIDLANSEIANQFTANPLKIPEITNFPTKGQKVIFSLIDPAVNGVPSGPGTASFLNVDLGVDVRVDGSPSAGGAGSFDDSIPKSLSYKTTYNWTLDSKNPDASFSYSFRNSLEVSEIYALRWTEAGIEIRGSGGSDGWMIAPPPTI